MEIEEYSKYKQFYKENVPELLLKYLKSKNWENFLDLGCGDGSLLYALDKKGFFKNKNVFAVDLSENRINLVKKINKNFLCFVADACSVSEIKNADIDFLVSEQVVEHVDNDENMIREVSRMLKSGKVVYLSTVFKKWYGWYFYKCNGKWVLDPTHLREYTENRQLLDIFKKYDLEILENKKTLTYRPVIDFILKKFGIRKNVFANNSFIQVMRNIGIPILGYYNWEIVCKKK